MMSDVQSELKVGDKVSFHSIIGRPATSSGHTVKSFHRLGHGELVAKITDKSGVVSLDALTKEQTP